MFKDISKARHSNILNILLLQMCDIKYAVGHFKSYMLFQMHDILKLVGHLNRCFDISNAV